MLGDGVATLLLAGIAVGSFLTAVQTFVLQRSASDIGAVYSWLLGSLSAASWQQVTDDPAVRRGQLGRHPAARQAPRRARPSATRRPGRSACAPAWSAAIVVAASALAAASAVAVSGLIGFVGIVIPHVARRLAGPSYTQRAAAVAARRRRPSSSSPTPLARTVLSPAELPIGVVTALVGAPAFVWVLRGTRPVGT